MKGPHIVAVVIIAVAFLGYMGVVRMQVVEWFGARFKGGAAALSDRVAGFVLIGVALALVIAIAF